MKPEGKIGSSDLMALSEPGITPITGGVTSNCISPHCGVVMSSTKPPKILEDEPTRGGDTKLEAPDVESSCSITGSLRITHN